MDDIFELLVTCSLIICAVKSMDHHHINAAFHQMKGLKSLRRVLTIVRARVAKIP